MNVQILIPEENVLQRIEPRGLGYGALVPATASAQGEADSEQQKDHNSE